MLQSGEVEALELFWIVEVLTHRVGPGGMMVQDFDLQLFSHQSWFGMPLPVYNLLISYATKIHTKHFSFSLYVETSLIYEHFIA